ncbi:hypothetical protein SFRURICE_003382 [Spodoptera frugiperda]|nr:hypothetical protein SFRURICE_003382 [Spodoptera frugiperda]
MKRSIDVPRYRPLRLERERVRSSDWLVYSSRPIKASNALSFRYRSTYETEKNALVVSVVSCQNLPGREPAGPDPYVKLQLLPDKQHKVKTRVVRKTRCPVYDEDFTFYGIYQHQISLITLHFVVLSFDRYSRDEIIGEVVAPLTSLQLQSGEPMALCREIQPRSLKMRSVGRGEVLVSLCWQPAAARLTVVLLKARNLPKMDVTGLADPYVKMYLLYNGQRIAKKKTHVKKRTLNPVFNESFVFEVPAAPNATLDHVSLELLVLDWDRVTKNEVIGRLELGAVGAGSARHHWREVQAAPRRQIADWHKLKDTSWLYVERKRNESAFGALIGRYYIVTPYIRGRVCTLRHVMLLYNVRPLFTICVIRPMK